MSLQSDLITTLAAVAGGRVHPQIAPEGSAYPLVNYRILNKQPVASIVGTIHATQYDVVFECWGASYSSALSTAAAVKAAIEASALTWYPIATPGEEYDAAADSYMEPVYYGFMHA